MRHSIQSHFALGSVAMDVKNVAAIVPVGQQFELLFTKTIAKVCADCGKSCLKVSTEFSTELDFHKVRELIQNADLILAELGTRNPNVLYLAGYAQGIGKRLLFLAECGENLLLDRHKYDVIIYHGDSGILAVELSAFLTRQCENGHN
jgi:hypothetical protein